MLRGLSLHIKIAHFFVATPVNRRLEQLRKKAPPKTTPKATDNDRYDCLNEFDTPIRESIKELLHKDDKETPQTKRRRYEAEGIRTPEYARTPALQEARRQAIEEVRTRHMPTESAKKREQQKTVGMKFPQNCKLYHAPILCIPFDLNSSDLSQ